MSAAYDRLAAGYYNSSLQSGSNPGGLAGQGAVRANWSPMLLDFADVAREGSSSAAAAADAAASALGAPGTYATSLTNFNIPGAVDAEVTFFLEEAGKLFIPAQTVVVASIANALDHVIGPILAFNPMTREMTVKARFISGAGAYAAWRVALAAAVDDTLTGRMAALEAANAQQRSAALFYAKEFI